MTATKPCNPFAGHWRIVWMSEWDEDHVDMDVPGHVTFSAGRSANFQFGMVQGQMDSKLDKKNSRRIAFTWHGFDEGDELTIIDWPLGCEFSSACRPPAPRIDLAI